MAYGDLGWAADDKDGCPDGPETFATVADISDDFALVLSDGRMIRLAGVEPPRATVSQPARPQHLRETLRARLHETTVGLAPLAAADRWQATPAIIFTQDGTLAQSLLADGLVRMRPDRAARPCRDVLRRAEALARTGAFGVWRDPALAPIDADAIEPYGAPPDHALEGLAIFEGRVASIGETPTRIYINLGKSRGGFAISVSKRDNALMTSDAIKRARVVGVRIRVRGLVDRHTGLRVDVSDADAIEIIDTERRDAAMPSR